MAASWGVKAWQGGHQLALKYRARGAPRRLAGATVLPSARTSAGNLASTSWMLAEGGKRGGQGQLSGALDTPSRPLEVTRAPLAASKTHRVGMPLTLKVEDSLALSSRAEKGSASQGIE